jgi:small conductance mechanosensitive channel
MPANWPELTLALALAIVAASAIAGLIARLVDSVLRTIVADEHAQTLVDRPKRIIQLLIFLITAAALALPALTLAGLETDVGADREAVIRWLLDSGLRIAVIAVAAYLVVRIGTAGARRFESEMSTGTGLDVLERTKRAQTLGRLLQKTLSIVVLVFAALMILRELDVDITPVLTGAGILGLAVGFGAQTLVRDIISGFFLILEDQVRVGDVAIVNGTGGLVEAINLRTIVLRDLEGTVHVFPNGEIKTLGNRTKDFSFYVMDIGIPYGEDPDRVAAALREIGGSLMEEAAFRPNILEPLEVLGVDAFGDSQVTIKARIKTVPLKQWEVGRELRRRIAHGFKERGIEIPFPQRTVWVRSEGSGGAGGAEGLVQKVPAGTPGTDPPAPPEPRNP